MAYKGMNGSNHNDESTFSTTTPAGQNWFIPYIYYGLVGVFLFAEIMNLRCHYHLKSFRKSDHDFTRMIPRKHGYSKITSANYFWELIAWIAFAFVA
jgi:hypothetical protein